MIRQLEARLHGFWNACGGKVCDGGGLSNLLQVYHGATEGIALTMSFLDTLVPKLLPILKCLHLWGDCGPHFRSYEFTRYALV